MTDREKVIKGLEFTKAMITFNPSTGEDIEPGNLNEADKTSYDACVDAIAMLKEQEQTPGGWVSVKDKSPKDGQDVLAYLNDGEETRIAPCNYSNNVWFDSVMNCVVVLRDVTHWMPLPEPPKEDE